jgi:hypothetical protein
MFVLGLCLLLYGWVFVFYGLRRIVYLFTGKNRSLISLMIAFISLGVGGFLLVWSLEPLNITSY